MSGTIAKRITSLYLWVFLLFSASILHAANYPLEIIQPQPNQGTNNRYYKAYPGILYEVPVGVFGGEYPFIYSLTTAPSGMTINQESGIITWPNPTTSGSPHSVSVRVSDAESSVDTVSWTVTVTTSGFVFLDASAGNGGNGSLGSPFNELADIWGEEGLLRTYDNYFVYLRGGTYGLTGGWWSECPGQQCKVHLNITAQPHVWMAYPGETVIIDHNLTPGSNGGYISLENGSTDVYFSGIKFQDMLNHGLRLGGGSPRIVLYKNIFYNGGPGVNGHNSSFVMFTGTGVQSASYKLIKDNVFDTASDWAFLKSYSTNKAVHEGNIYRNPGGLTEGLAIKAYDQYVSVRGNQFFGEYSAGSISGNWNAIDHIDICYNNIQDARDDFGSDLYGGLTINFHDTAGPVNIYRNTIEGTVTTRFATNDDGPFRLYNNVIINRNSGTPSGSHVSHENVSDSSRVILGTAGSSNLTGYPSDGIIDANGNLTDDYSSYIGTHGHLVDASQVTPPAVSVPSSFRFAPNN